jgi:transposase
VATTRRSWSKAQKKAIIAELDVGGATLSEVARRHGIHASLLFRWRKTLGSVMGSAPIEADASGTPTSAPATQRFMPVMLPPPPSPSAPSPTTSRSKPSLIEIVLGGGRTVRVGADVDVAALVRIIDALEKPR